MSVVKDLRLKTPYIGQVNLRTGEIAADLAYYYVQSEQTPSLVSLGVIASDAEVTSAGGVLLAGDAGLRRRADQHSWSSARRSSGRSPAN